MLGLPYPSLFKKLVLSLELFAVGEGAALDRCISLILGHSRPRPIRKS